MRGRKTMVRSVAAMAATAGVLAGAAGPAQAYDMGSCQQKLGTTNVEAVDSITVNHGPVDLGDLAHVSGTPLGRTAVCWGKDGSVAVLGRVFADSGWALSTAKAEIRWFNAAGASGGPITYTVTGNFAASKVISERMWFNGSPVTRVTIKISSTVPGRTPYERGERRGS